MRNINVILFAYIFPIATALSQSAKQADTQSRIRQGVLDNGLSYFIVRNDIPEGVIGFSLIVKTGFYNEARDERGLSHLIEHLGMRSTVHFPEGLKKYFLKRGFSEGQNISASTSEITNYHLVIPSSDHTLFESAFLALKDWSCGIVFRPGEVDEERAAVINEFSLTKDSVSQAYFTSQYLLLDRHPLYARTVDSIDLKNVANVSVTDIEKIYKQWYTPSQQAIVIVGEVDVNAVESKIKKMFSDIQDGNERAKELGDLVQMYKVSLDGTNKLVTITHGARDPSIKVEMYKKRQSVSVSADDKIKSNLMDLLFNQLLNNRFRNTRCKDNSFRIGLHREAIHKFAQIDALSANISVKSSHDVKGAIESALREIRSIERWGFSEQELRRAVGDVKIKIQARENYRSSTISAAAVEAFFNSTELQIDGVDRLCLLEKVTVREINDQYKKWLDLGKDVDVFISLPSRTLQRDFSKEQVFSWVSDVQKEDVLPFAKQQEVVELAEPIGHRDSRKKYIQHESTTFGATEIKLTNGVRVIINRIGPRKNAGDTWNEVAIRCIKPLKGLGDTYGTIDRLRAVAEIVPFAKVGNLTYEEFDAWRNSRNVNGYLSLTPYIEPQYAGFIGGCSLDNLPSALKMIRYYGAGFKIGQQAVDRWTAGVISRASAERTSFQIFEDSVRKILERKSGESNHSKPSITASEAEKIYQGAFANFQDFTVLISGYFEREDVIELVAEYLGAIPAARVHSKAQTYTNTNAITTRRSGEGNNRVVIKRDSTGTANVLLFFDIERQLTFKEVLEFKVVSEIMQRALRRRLRDQEKGVYGVVCGLRNTSMLEPGFIAVSFDAIPEKVDLLVDATVDEWNRLAETVDDSTFTSALIAVQSRDSNSLTYSQNNIDNLVDQIKAGYSNPNPFHSQEVFSKMVLSDIRSAMKGLVDPDHYLLFTLF